VIPIIYVVIISQRRRIVKHDSGVSFIYMRYFYHLIAASRRLFITLSPLLFFILFPLFFRHPNWVSHIYYQIIPRPFISPLFCVRIPQTPPYLVLYSLWVNSIYLFCLFLFTSLSFFRHSSFLFLWSYCTFFWRNFLHLSKLHKVSLPQLFFAIFYHIMDYFSFFLMPIPQESRIYLSMRKNLSLDLWFVLTIRALI